MSTATPGLRASSAGPRVSTSDARCRGSPRSRRVGGLRFLQSVGAPAIVWVDSFSDCFSGDAVAAAVSVLAAAGYAPQLVERPACCGLTWISTGQLDGARRQLRTALDILHPLRRARERR